MPHRRTLDEFVAAARRREPPPRGGETDTRVLEAVRRLEARLAALEEEVRGISAGLRELAELVRGLEEALRGGERRPQARRTAYDLLREQGFISLSSLRGKVKNPRALIDSLERRGAIVLELEDDVIAVEPSFYRSFVEELGRIETADEAEAARRLGRYARLFDALRKTGLIYFDHKDKKWVFV